MTTAYCEPTPQQRMYRLNQALHKRGEHACNSCLKIFARTPENFHWQNRAKGQLYGLCKECHRIARRGSHPDQYQRHKAQYYAGVLLAKRQG